METRRLALQVGLLLLPGLRPAEFASAQDRPYIPEAVANQRMDSLEQVALTTQDVGERVRALLGIGVFGITWKRLPLPPGAQREMRVYYPGVVGRLIRLYRRIDEHWTRVSIMEDLSEQAERAQAVAVLEPEAREPARSWTDLGGARTLPFLAVHVLRYMGTEGSEALERLQRGSPLKDPLARLMLDSLSRAGFPPPGGA